MKNSIQLLLSSVALVGLAFGQVPATPTAPVMKDKAVTTAKDAATEKAHQKVTTAKVVTVAPTPAEIADAKAKGMVWVNLKSGVIHKDGEHFGTTKHGKFMMEADAVKAGYKVAQESSAKKAVKVTKVAKPAAAK